MGCMVYHELTNDRKHYVIISMIAIIIRPSSVPSLVAADDDEKNPENRDSNFESQHKKVYVPH